MKGKTMKRTYIYGILIILSLIIVHLIPGTQFKSFVITGLVVSLLISIFETSYKNLFSLTKKPKSYYMNISIILESFFKILIPTFLIINLSALIVIELSPKSLNYDKSFFHIEIISFMIVLIIFTFYSLVNLNSRERRIESFMYQLFEANNINVNSTSEHFKKVDKLLEITFRLISNYWLNIRSKSIWILIPDYDPENNERFFRIVHVACNGSDFFTYSKLLNKKVPFMNANKWIGACDEFYKKCKKRRKKCVEEKVYSEFKKRKNKWSSVAGYIYLRNLPSPILSKIGEENCLVYNDAYLDLYKDDKENIRTKKVIWKSMIAWHIIYRRKKIGICFFFDTEKWGFVSHNKNDIKILTDVLGPIIYNGIERNYYGDTAKKFMKNARSIDSPDEIVAALGSRYKNHNWKKQIKELQKICKVGKKIGNGY